MKELILMDVGWQNFSATINKRSLNNKKFIEKEEIIMKGIRFNIEYKDLVEEVVNYYTYEEWKDKLKGCVPMDDKIINHSKKQVMYEFIRAYVKQLIVEIYNEIEIGNTVRFGKFLELRLYAEKYFIKRLEFYRRYISVKFIYSFRKSIKYNYVGNFSKKVNRKYFFSMLNYHKANNNAEHFYNT